MTADEVAPTADDEANGEAPDMTPEEIVEALKAQQNVGSYTVLDTLSAFGIGIAELQRQHKIPHDKGIRLLEMILQYDINRRHLDQQSPPQMPFGDFAETPGAMLTDPPPTAEI